MKAKSGILLDVGCRNRKESNFVGINDRPATGVDIVHDLESFPYPFETESCLTIKAAHVVEHIKPWLVFQWFDEMWRLLIPSGQLAISAPFANSQGFFNDPSHCTYINEATFQHLDPAFPMYKQHEPRPWKIEYASWQYGGNIEAVLSKRNVQDVKSIDLTSKAMMLGALQKPNELTAFLDMIKGLNLSAVMEIGTAHGGVFYTLCQMANPDAMIISLDLPGGDFGGGYLKKDIERFRTFAKEKQKLHFLQDDSHSAITQDAVSLLLGKEKLDLLFIDGDHTYDGVKKDFEMYSPLVKETGLIAFHDICHHDFVPSCEVDRFWKEIKGKYEHWEFIDQNDTTWGGIGVIRKRSFVQPKPTQTKIGRAAK